MRHCFYCVLGFIALALSPNAFSSDFVIQKIRVEGLQRIEKGTVYNALPIKVGDTFHEGDATLSLKRLFKTGFFKDVRINRDGQTLIIKVKERPAIGHIVVTGNKEIKTDDLVKGLATVGIAEGLTFESSVLTRVQKELEQQYYARGKYGVSVKTAVKPLSRNRVSVAIRIHEGNTAKIREITLIGNKQFSQRTLLGEFKLTTSGVLTWFTGSDHYEREKLTADIERLRSFYLDRGFLKFALVSTQVSISSDKQSIYITITLSEGARYRLSGFEITGNTVIAQQDLRSLVTLTKGDVFNRAKVMASSEAITDRLGDEGYAFAKVNAIQDINEKNHTVRLTFYVDPANKVYVRQINYYGNHATQDRVLRRETRQMESTWLSSRKIKQSRTNLMQLGFFEDVSVDTKSVPGTLDVVDVDFSVKEQSSGQLTGGVGFSQVDGLMFNLGVRQTNFLGSGKLVDFAFRRSSAYNLYRIDYNNPYWTIDGVSRGFGLYYNETDLAESNLSNYNKDTFGGTLNYGIPLSENNRLTTALNIENIQINIGNNASREIRTFIADEGRRFTVGRLILTWQHLGLDRVVFPRQGLNSVVSFSTTLPGSELDYFHFISNNSYYIPLTRQQDTIVLLKANVGYGHEFGRTSRYPLFEHFYAGGISSVRGYRGNTLGPRDSRGDPLGGNVRLTGGAELIFPVPFVETNALRTSVFFDAGNVFSNRTPISNESLRMSVGVTAQWISPMGPFVVSFGQPIRRRASDDIERFQFTIGTTF